MAEGRSAEGVELNAEGAQLLAWAALALLNQALIAWLLPATSAAKSLLHRGFDFGQLLALGALSWGFVRGARWLAAKRGLAPARPWQEATLLALTAFLAGLTTASDDVSNLAERFESPRWVWIIALAGAFSLALGASRLLLVFRGRLGRVLLACAGCALTVLNASSLPRDYFACHLMAAWLSAQLIAGALEGLRLDFPSARGWLALELVAAALGVASIAWPAPGDVRLRLHALPSSVLAPFLARLLPADAVAETELVPAKIKRSAWFSSRNAAPEVPPSRAVRPSKPPIVMFFTIDAFRADVLENPEHLKKLPNLAKLRQEASYFPVARSPTASTMTTMASVFSGRYYSQLHWRSDKQVPLVEKTPRFPELLTARGVRTLLLGPTLGRIYGKSGIARGFQQEVVVRQKDHPATKIVDGIMADLDTKAGGPTFVYAHFIEPHAPYDLAGKKGTQFQRYVREIGLVDRELGRLRAYLEQKGLADRSYFIISADHGEGFGEHGTFNHARTAYEELVRVPFFFYLPERSGQELSTPVTLMDVGPTVLDLFDLPAPGFWMGQSLLPVVAGYVTQLERPIAIDTGRQIQALCLDSGRKVIFTRLEQTTEVYDLKRDPGELTNLASNPDAATNTAIQIGSYFFDAIKLREAGFESPEIKF